MTRFSRKMLIYIMSIIFLLLATDTLILTRSDEVPSLYQESRDLKFPAFSTKDLRGNIVTQEIFMGKLSVVCLWVTKDAATGRSLLADLSAWQNAEPSFQLIGIVGDVRDTDAPETVAVAQSIAQDCAADIPQLLVNDELTDFLRRIRNAPTVCFFDNRGNIVGQPIVGNEPDLVKKEARRLLNANALGAELGHAVQNSLFLRP